MILKSLHLAFMVLLLMSMTNSKPQLHDISYSELELTEQPQPSQQITLTPQRQILANWQYPNTWDVTQFLTQSLDTELSLPKLSNIDASIAFIKDKVSQFLKLSDKAQLFAKNIKQLPTMKNDQSLNVKQEEFDVLKAHESRLSALNQQIDTKAIDLEKIVQEMMVKQENPLFKQAALNFEKKALTKKISLFEELYKSSISGKSKADSGYYQKKVTDYFKDLDNFFKTDNSLVDEVESLLKSHNQLAILRARVTSLNSQLKAHELTFSEKEECAKEFEKIKEKQAHDKQVLKLVETLKEKKLAQSGPNKYCEGVVKKLIDRVKKLLVGYDYIFECSQQLQGIRLNRDKIQAQLNEAQKKLDQLEKSQGMEAFRVKFNSEKQVIMRRATQFNQSQLDSFYMHPDTLQSAMTQTRNRIVQIQDMINNLPTNTNHNMQQIQQRIRQHVGQLKILKSTYCKENEAYRKDTQIIEDRLIKLEQQEEYNTWLRNVLVEKFEQLEQVKSQMRLLHKEIEDHLENQGRV